VGRGVRVLAVLVLLAAVLGAAGRSVQQSRSGRSEGVAYGKVRSQGACLRAVLDGDRQCRGLSCFFHNRAFYRSCMASAPRAGGLCAGVPSGGNLLKLESWMSGECRRRGREDRTCWHVLRHAYSACREARRGPL